MLFSLITKPKTNKYPPINSVNHHQNPNQTPSVNHYQHKILVNNCKTTITTMAITATYSALYNVEMVHATRKCIVPVFISQKLKVPPNGVNLSIRRIVATWESRNPSVHINPAKWVANGPFPIGHNVRPIAVKNINRVPSTVSLSLANPSIIRTVMQQISRRWKRFAIIALNANTRPCQA